MRVLLATDGSESARMATQWMTAFPLPPSTELQVLAVAVQPLSMPELVLSPDFYEAISDAARQAAEEARDTLARRWPATTIQVLQGQPQEAIPRVAQEWSADLVVVGARGFGAVKRFLLGSVSTALVHSAPCPVLVVKERPPELRKMVVAVDGSPGAAAAVRFLAGLPLDRGLHVCLLGVAEPFYASRSGPEALGPAIEVALDRLVQERRAELERVLGSIVALDGKVGAVERRVAIGHPADEILAVANDPGTDLAVVGTRGLGLVKRLALGSVSERVLHHAGCAVLVVKDRHP